MALDHDNTVQVRRQSQTVVPANTWPIIVYGDDGMGWGNDGEPPIIQPAHPG